jgi:hypothetical protein
MNLVVFAIARNVKKQTVRFFLYLCHVGQFYKEPDGVLFRGDRELNNILRDYSDQVKVAVSMFFSPPPVG